MIVYSGQLRGFIFSGSGKEITLYRLFDRDMCLFTASCLLKNIHFDIHVTAEKETQALLILPGFISSSWNPPSRWPTIRPAYGVTVFGCDVGNGAGPVCQL